MLSRIAHPRVAADDPDPFRTGRDLHCRIPSERWCITRSDLQLFEYHVQQHWILGKIPNDPAFPISHHDDPAFGPSMYAVNEHVIKPLTAEYGGMSYALLLHPEGLQCDIFVTHAWGEGVFEFLSKVYRGWPKGCSYMYICSAATTDSNCHHHSVPISQKYVR